MSDTGLDGLNDTQGEENPSPQPQSDETEDGVEQESGSEEVDGVDESHAEPPPSDPSIDDSHHEVERYSEDHSPSSNQPPSASPPPQHTTIPTSDPQLDTLITPHPPIITGTRTFLPPEPVRAPHAPPPPKPIYQRPGMTTIQPKEFIIGSDLQSITHLDPHHAFDRSTLTSAAARGQDALRPEELTKKIGGKYVEIPHVLDGFLIVSLCPVMLCCSTFGPAPANN